MATCTGTAEQETLKLMFSYLANSIDAAPLLSAALSRQLITEPQRVDCFSEPDPNKKAEKFLGHLQRAVIGDSKNFHIFVQLLNESGQKNIASHLKTQEESTRSTLAATASNYEDNSTVDHVVVAIPDTLVEELANLRFAYAELLRNYEEEVWKSPKAQEEFVKFLPRLLERNFDSDQTFQLLFNILIEEEVSLFNIHYLKQICRKFPEDVCAVTRKLVDRYERRCKRFMASTTVSQFKKLFPASATPYNLSAEKIPIKLKLSNVWGKKTLQDLNHLIIKLGVPLHLCDITHGCIAVLFLCSIADVKDLKINVNSSGVADLLQTKGVLQVFIGEELMLECSQPEPAAVSPPQTQNPVLLHILSKTDIEDIDYLCPICTEPLTQPFLTECGHLLCSNCRDHLLNMNKTECPTCREPETLSNSRLNKYHQRLVNNLKVRCHYYDEGCKWEGEIRDLQNHLDPENGNCGIACIFGCGKYVRRGEMKEHKKHHCHKRPTTCEYCGYHNTHDIITEKHYPVCLRYPKEQIINQAVAITPPPATVSPQYLYNLPPVVFTITDYQEMKQANEVWTSPPYYTHTRGYKFCLKVYPNGDGSGKGTHISVYANLMRGEYDDELEWPFEGDISTEVRNWKEDQNHILNTILLNRYTDEDGTITSRLIGKKIGKGYGYSKIISHTDLPYNSASNTEYLHDDCLQVRVCDVTVYSTTLLHKTPSWQDPLTTTQSVCEFTLTEFSKRKHTNNEYYSLPFYTYSQGYKLCLRVFSNGAGSGEGTHVSIYATLMRGEHDHCLKWPFTGDALIELLNWREDKEHHKKAVKIVESHGFVQVTKQAYGKGKGNDQFISHSSLSYNSATNTEYLQDDCLRLRFTHDIIACPFNCGEYYHRHVIKKHINHSCCKRPTTCEYCGYHNTHDIVTEKHYPVCLQFPITCPNKCRTECFELVHMQLPQHLKECPHQLVECPCSNTGCSVQLPRREMAAHTLQQHNQVLEQTTNQVVAITPPPATVSPQYLYNLPPVVFTITDYQEMKQANEVWTSPPYYTHTRGFKFCLKVYPNGDGSGKGTHISVYAYLMRGEYDDELEWPFEGDINVEVCNWREDKNHILETIHLNRYTDEDGTITSRVMDMETEKGSGYPEIISHINLTYNSTTNTKYLRDDCLQVRVSDVVVYSTTALLHKTPSWQDPLTTTQSVCEFTLTEFSKRKQFNNQYYSPPFYTHPQGYKLCLIVYANGDDSGEGTHVSIYAMLMRGEHDQHLQWPFTGDIIIELLNWRDNKEHHKTTLEIFESYGGFVQVTEGKYGNTIMGYDQFISHSSLPYNSTTNTEYLHDDCLRLRVSDVAVYSTALLHKTPSWQDPLTTIQSVCEFTLTEFSKRKQFNSRYHSPPFYTHPQGYKLCLVVFANGYVSGEGTRVSMYVYIMRGEHDQHLQWPFTGDIIFELLNWRENKGHHKITLEIVESDGFVQVTKEMYGNGKGYHQFISHSSLPYNSTTNTEYLQEDCLRLRVNVYSQCKLIHASTLV